MREGDVPAIGDLAISGDRIVAPAPGEHDDEIIDAAGCYVMPGLVQTHVHLVQTIFRGLAEDLALLEWLRSRIWPLEAAHDEASLRATARLGLLDLLTTGTTTILDMGTTHGGDVVRRGAGRLRHPRALGQAMMDGGAGVPPGLQETTRGSLDASLTLAKRWNGAGNGRLDYAFAPRFALSCTRELLEAVSALSREQGALIHTHSNENLGERQLVERETGMAPAAYLDAVGLVNERAVLRAWREPRCRRGRAVAGARRRRHPLPVVQPEARLRDCRRAPAAGGRYHGWHRHRRRGLQQPA